MSALNQLLKTARELTSSAREALPQSAFAIPEREAYPIHDKPHGENALARVSQHGTPSERQRVRKAVYAKYPDLKASFKERHGESPTTKENVRKKELGKVGLALLKKAYTPDKIQTIAPGKTKRKDTGMVRTITGTSQKLPGTRI